MFFMIFTGLTAPLSYAYRMIFGWCSSNAPLGFKEKPVTQPVDLFQSHLTEFVRSIRPVEGITVEPFHQDPESGSVPLKDLYRSTPTVAERKHAA